MTARISKPSKSGIRFFESVPETLFRPKLGVSNFKNGLFFLIFSEFYRFIFLKFETLWASLSATTQQVGIADLTASTALDAVPHS